MRPLTGRLVVKAGEAAPRIRGLLRGFSHTLELKSTFRTSSDGEQ